MKILRQLWQDAQSVLRDMSVTQRVAVTFLILTVAVWLSFAAWMGSTPGEIGRRPLPMEVDPGDSGDILNRLKDKGIKSAEYDLDSRRVLINSDEEKKAIIALAEDGLLKGAHQFGFQDMLDKWAFSDTNKKSDEAMRLARSNEVARLIESLDPVKEAQVIYSDDQRITLFGAAHKKTASVRVKTKFKKALTEDIANTIISLVSAAKAGLDPRDVVVADQLGNKYHSMGSDTLTAVGRQKLGYEFQKDEELRRRIENVMRSSIPNVQYDGDVLALPKHEIDFNYKEELLKEVLPGEVAQTSTRKTSQKTSKRPSEEPGVNPNVRRSANLGNSTALYTEESLFDEKTADKTMQNSIRETAIKYGPVLKNLTVSAIIHLPYQLKRDDQGKPVQAVNELGQPLIDPDSRLPMWERESVPPLPVDKIDELKRQIAQTAGIALADIPEKIEVSQVPWLAPVHAPIGGESPWVIFVRSVNQNMNAIVTLGIFSIVVYILYRYATRPVPTEIDDPLEQESLTLAMARDEEEEPMPDEEWDNLRSKVTAAVQEDPKRAANLLKRWMRKE